MAAKNGDSMKVVRAATAVAAALSLVGLSTPAQALPGLTSCADPHATNARRISTTPPGAATSAITGHAVTTAFTLGGDSLVAEPPPAGYLPAVTLLQAGCELASAVGPGGTTARSGRLALATLTLRTDLPQQLWLDPSINSRIPALGAVPVYQSRVAWILITPGQLDCFSTTEEPVHPQYEVIAIDAATGTSAVLYQDTLPPCAGSTRPPLVSIPYQQVSIPWHLLSRAKDQTHAKVTAAWAACEKFSWTGYRRSEMPPNLPTPAQQAKDATKLAPYQMTMSHRPLWSLTVSVNRPIGPACGKRKSHVITVFPPELDKTLPQQMRHTPLGALITKQY